MLTAMTRTSLARFTRAALAASLVVLAASCATATAPGGGDNTDASTHDSSTSFDSGGATDSSVGDTNKDVPCLAPKKTCGGVCIDVTIDNKNCGDCGKTCGETTACVAGACTAVGCTKDEVSCPDGKCANLLTDANHCGDCTTKCGLDS